MVYADLFSQPELPNICVPTETPLTKKDLSRCPFVEHPEVQLFAQKGRNHVHMWCCSSLREPDRLWEPQQKIQIR